MTLQVMINKLYSILNISRQNLKRGVRKCVEIKPHQVTNPSGMVINSANFNYCCSALSFMFLFLSLSSYE